MPSSTSSSPLLWSQETEPPTHQLLLSLVLLQARWREAGFPHGDPEVPALTAWILRGRSQTQLEHLRGLTLWPWRREDPLQQRGPLAGHLLLLPISSSSNEAVILSSRCWTLFSQVCLPARLPAVTTKPFDIPAGGPETSMEAERGRRHCWRKKQVLFQALIVSFSSGIFFLSPFLCPCLYFWQYDAICPR